MTPKQQRFIEEYCIDLNATQAAIRAGYSKKTANEQGNRLLANVSIKKEIDERLQNLTEKAGVTAEMVIKELASIGFSKITDYLAIKDELVTTGYKVDDKGNLDHNKPIRKKYRTVDVFKTDTIPDDKLAAISEIKQTKDGISLKLNDKVKALELLGKNLKLFTDKIEAENNSTGEISVNINVIE